MSNWFDVDKAGLAKLMAGKPKAFIVFELLQNAWDQNVTHVDVTLEPVAGTRNAQITVTDDDPDGFADLRDAYTLVCREPEERQRRAAGPLQSGREAGLGPGEVRLDRDDHRHVSSSTKQGTPCLAASGGDAGSMFRATIPMTKADLEEIDQAVKRLIPPADIATTFNGRILEPRVPVAFFHEVLPTVVADEEGVLRKTSRKTLVRVYEPAAGRDGDAL